MDWNHEYSGVRKAPQPVLVVSDSAQMRDYLAGVLEHHGYPVLLASNGIDAIELIEACRPCLAIVDNLSTGVSAGEMIASFDACFDRDAPAVMALTSASLPDSASATVVAVQPPVAPDHLIRVARQLMLVRQWPAAGEVLH